MKQTIKLTFIVMAFIASGSAFSNSVTTQEVVTELKDRKPPAAHLQVRNVTDRVDQRIDRQLTNQADIAIEQMIVAPEYQDSVALDINL